MIEAAIKIQIYEFDDFLEDKLNDIVRNHAVAIWQEFQSFLIDAGQVEITNTFGVKRNMRF